MGNKRKIFFLAFVIPPNIECGGPFSDSRLLLLSASNVDIKRPRLGEDNKRLLRLPISNIAAIFV
jgi:hypothetical protein